MNIEEIYKLICKLTLEEKIKIYKRLQDEIVDEILLKEADKRIKNAKDDDLIPEEEVLKTFKISKEQLNNVDVEVE